MQFGTCHAGGGPTDMQYTAVGRKAHGPSGAGQAVHEFDFLEIQEEPGVEQADRAQGFGAEHDAGARHPVDFGRAVGAEDAFGQAECLANAVHLAPAKKFTRDRGEAEGTACL